MSGRLAGRVALVSGTGAGTGRAIAQMFAREGAVVVGCDLDRQGAEETVRLVTEAGGQMTSTAPLDAADPDAAAAWVHDAAGLRGRIDVLVNNAARVRWGSIESTAVDDFRWTVVNELDLAYYATQAAWAHLVASGSGSVINIGSIAGVTGVREQPKLAHSAAKAGLAGLTRQLAAEGALHNVRVNTLTPGVIDTEASRPMIALGEDGPLGVMMRGVTLPRLGRVEDVAYACVFLASEESGYMTGQELIIDGGDSTTR